MAKCWTCGAEIPGGGHYLFTCPNCKAVEELESLRNKFDELKEVQERGFEILSDRLQGVASIIEWGFQEIAWELAQQTEVLRSIDHTLKTPNETRANEWRQMAEELRKRGVLDESEKFFLKALKSNPLDYRIYVGLAETHLRMGEFDEAKSILEKSLRHAPGIERGNSLNSYRTFDYKSYSYRLIGHVHACKEDYSNAVSVLESAIELSPAYHEAIYDHSQYCAQLRNKENCLSSLKNAIMGDSFYFYLAQKERNFDPLRKEVHHLLSDIKTLALSKAKESISKAEEAMLDTNTAIDYAQKALRKCIDKTVLSSSITKYEEAKSKLNLAKEKVASEDYKAFLEAEPIAKEAYRLANSAKDDADEKHRHYVETRSKRVKYAFRTILGSIFIWALATGVCGIIGGIIGGVVGALSTHWLIGGSADWGPRGFIIGANIGMAIGWMIGMVHGISRFRKKLHKYH